MKKIICLSLLMMICLAGALFSKEEQNYDGELYFKDLFLSYESESEMKKDPKSNTPEGELKMGIMYFMEGTSADKGKKEKEESLEKAKEIFEKLWRKDRGDQKRMILLAYTYTAICGVETNLEAILKYIFRARNYFTLVIQKMENNLDARLGRLRININLTPQNGRPDDMLLEDSLVYIENYNRLSPEMKSDEYFESGLSEAYLGAAVIYDYRNQKTEAAEAFAHIDSKWIPPHLNKMYKLIERKYGK